MIQIYDEPAEAIKTAHKKGKKLTSTQVFGIITIEEFQEHDLLKNLDGVSIDTIEEIFSNFHIKWWLKIE